MKGQETDLSLLIFSETEALEGWPFCLPGECEMINETPPSEPRSSFLSVSCSGPPWHAATAT